MGENYSCDNSGNRVPPSPDMADSVAGSGITLTIVNDLQDYTENDLVGGQMYVITFVADKSNSVIFASSTGATVATPANIEWVFPTMVTCVFRMPQGKTTLYYHTNDSGTVAYIRKLA